MLQYIYIIYIYTQSIIYECVPKVKTVLHKQKQLILLDSKSFRKKILHKIHNSRERRFKETGQHVPLKSVTLLYTNTTLLLLLMSKL